jgi:hypothetical protein
MTRDELISMAREANPTFGEHLFLQRPEFMERFAEVVAARAVQRPDRAELQATGSHPAPCAKFCEATAFNFEIRRLKAMKIDRVQAEEREACADRVEELLQSHVCASLASDIAAAIRARGTP